MIQVWNKTFVFDTKNTTYCFRVLETGQLEHLYYGRTLVITEEEDTASLAEKHAFAPGNTVLYDNAHTQLFIVRYNYRKLQMRIGECCISKLEKVAKHSLKTLRNGVAPEW